MSNTEALRSAAQAVLDRWDSPQWEWTKHGPTADLMHALRAALAQQPAASGEPVAKWDDPRVQAVYQMLCSEEVPPPAQHWEGWTARRIVDAITAQPAPARVSLHITHLTDWLAPRFRAAGGKAGITDVAAWAEEVMRWTEHQHGITAQGEPK